MTFRTKVYWDLSRTQPERKWKETCEGTCRRSLGVWGPTLRIRQNSWAIFRVWNRSLDGFSGIENFREISWKFVDVPWTSRGMQTTLLHAKSVANEFAVISKPQDISPLLMELMHKGNRVVKTPRSFENFWFPIPGFLVSRVFWFLTIHCAIADFT